MLLSLKKESPPLSYDFSVLCKPSFFKNEKVREIAKAAFIELGVTLAFAGVTSLFVPIASGIAFLFISSIVLVAINVFIRLSAEVYEKSLLKAYPEGTGPKDRSLADRISCGLIKYFPAILFTLFDQITRDTVIHEMGHFVASKLLFTSSRASFIKIIPWSGGGMYYLHSGLTAFGNLFGKSGATAILIIAGVGTSLVFALIGLGVAHCLKDKYKEVSRYLNTMALTIVAAGVFYAMSALWTDSTKSPSNDFAALAGLGIHPIVSIITIIAIPLIFKLGMCLYTETHSKLGF